VPREDLKKQSLLDLGIKYRTEFETSWATPEKMLILDTGDWRFQRPVTKIGKCCQCGWCFIFCPTGCIEEKESYFTANLDYCKGCGICAQVCPRDAIMMVREEK
jgi:2-oxoacid:acceptor oxidoreductase delta subunit (pyruvate/2-ketoisovalerate family)